VISFGSVCSGIEAATVAWAPHGFQPAFYSEIDAFPRAVLQHRHPGVPLHGDFTTIRAGEYGPIRLLVGGTPCQSFSVAGLRGGLDDDRGNLALEYLRLAQRLRPDWLVWENVPGVLSSNGGRDFGAILGGLVELRYGFAYRTLDAQYVRTCRFGRAVPQRRRRVFVVGHSGGDWRRAAAVLFDRESLSGNPPPRRRPGSAVAALTANGVGTCGADDNQAQAGHLIPVAFALRGRDDAGAVPEVHGRGDTVGALRAASGGSSRDYIAFQTRGSNIDLGPDVSGAIGTNCDRASGSAPMVATDWAVRRLTPLECERLQGFPDNWTKIPWKAWRPMDTDETPESCMELGLEVRQTKGSGRWRVKDVDGPRYKALGNSMAVNAMELIGERIALVDAMEVLKM
jgi:DNA (cytosine-5)-methyltransferase 1